MPQEPKPIGEAAPRPVLRARNQQGVNRAAFHRAADPNELIGRAKLPNGHRLPIRGPSWMKPAKRLETRGMCSGYPFRELPGAVRVARTQNQFPVAGQDRVRQQPVGLPLQSPAEDRQQRPVV